MARARWASAASGAAADEWWRRPGSTAARAATELRSQWPALTPLFSLTPSLLPFRLLPSIVPSVNSDGGGPKAQRLVQLLRSPAAGGAP